MGLAWLVCLVKGRLAYYLSILLVSALFTSLTVGLFPWIFNAFASVCFISPLLALLTPIFSVYFIVIDVSDLYLFYKNFNYLVFYFLLDSFWTDPD
jgi:hypothetical protein